MKQPLKKLFPAYPPPIVKPSKISQLNIIGKNYREAVTYTVTGGTNKLEMNLCEAHPAVSGYPLIGMHKD